MKKLLFFLFYITCLHIEAQNNSLVVTTEDQFSNIPQNTNMVLVHARNGYFGTLWKLIPNDQTTPESADVRVLRNKSRYRKVSIGVSDQLTKTSLTVTEAPYIPLWSAGNTLGKSILFQRGSALGINTITPTAALDIVGNARTTGNFGIGTLPPTQHLLQLGNSNADAAITNANLRLGNGIGTGTAIQMDGSAPGEMLSISNSFGNASIFSSNALYLNSDVLTATAPNLIEMNSVGGNIYLKTGTGLTKGLTLSNEGRVGISSSGTTTSSQLFVEASTATPGIDNVKEALTLQNSATNAQAGRGVTLDFRGTGGAGLAQIKVITSGAADNAGHLIFSTTNASGYNEHARITNAGRMGIGRTSPTYALDVAGTMRTDSNTYAAAVTGGLVVGTAAYDGYKLDVSGWTRTKNNTFLATNDGSVGIGTTIPGAKLHVTGPTSSVATPALGNLTNSVAFFGNSSLGYGLSVVPSGDGSVHIQSQRIDATSTTYPITLNPMGGNVGVGTPNPSFAFEVAGTAAIRSGLGLQVFRDGSNSISNHMYFANAANNRAYNWQLNSDGSAADFWGFAGAWNRLMTINANGNVGVGTDTPTSKMQVIGIPEYANNAAAVTGGLTVGAFYHTAGALKIVIP